MITSSFLRTVASLGMVVLIGVAAFGCGSKSSAKGPSGPPCRADVGDDVEVAGRTGVEGVKTGATTAVEGVKTFGSATAGLVEGGSEEAKSRWKEGSAETKRTAREGGAGTKQESHVPKCR